MGRKRKQQAWEQRAERNDWHLYELPRYDGKGYVFAVLQRVEGFELRHHPPYERNHLPEWWEIVYAEQLGSVIKNDCFVSRDKAAVMAEWDAMLSALAVEVA